MKKLGILLLLSSCLLSFYLQPKWTATKTPATLITQYYHQDLDAFDFAIQDLQQIADTFSNTAVSIRQLRQSYLNCRLAYKRMETFIAYLAPNKTQQWINGKAQFHKDSFGFGALDLLIFDERPYQYQSNIPQLTQQLYAQFRTLKTQQQKQQLSDAQIFEAARFSLIRLFTLGLTGYDNPISQQALPEAVETMGCLQRAICLYFPEIAKQQLDSPHELQIAFLKTIHYLKDNNNFDYFDRLTFFKKHLQPLYQQLTNLRQGLNIAPAQGSTPLTPAINLKATHLFDARFLQYDYFAPISSSKITEKQTALGRRLFTDPILYMDEQTSCASCHQADHAFANSRTVDKIRHQKQTIYRNTPTLYNALYTENYFCDSRTHELTDLYHHAIFPKNKLELPFIPIIRQLKESPRYRQLFKQAFPKHRYQNISATTIRHALTAYLQSLESWNSPFDQYIRGENRYLSQDAKKGFNLFMGKAACGTCHFPPTFSGLLPPFFQQSQSASLGIPANQTDDPPKLDKDKGQFYQAAPKEQQKANKYHFKVPSVRNVALTAPYMHNGVWNELKTLVEFYNKGGGKGIGIDEKHQSLLPHALDLSPKEQQQIIAFLETLTDNAIR